MTEDHGLRGLPDTPQVAAALEDPQEFFAAAAAGGDNWADPYGGPDGVAVLAGVIRDQLTEQARVAASLRQIAVAEMLRNRSMAAVGKVLGITKAAVYKINSEATSQNRFYDLLAKGRW